MSSISALSSASSTYRMPPPRRTSGSGEDPMAAVAEKLGLSSDDLKSQLQDGKSLDDIATDQGVSHEDLISAIKAGMPTDATSAASSVDATQMAEKIASTKGMPLPPPGGTGAPGNPRGENTGLQDSSKLSRISELLSMDEGEVTTSATSASKLVELLQNKGVDLDQLRNVLNSGDLLDVAA